jgi:hypothetical protein
VSATESNASDGTRRRSISPLSILVVACSAVAIAATVWVRGSNNGGVPVWRTAGDLPARTIITGRDVKLVADGSADDQPAEDVIGHLTLRRLGRGAVVRQADIGPDIQDELGSDAVVVGLNIAPANAVAGDLGPGDRVLLVVAASHIEGVVMSIRLVGGRYDVAVAVGRADAASHDWFRHGSAVRLVRRL